MGRDEEAWLAYDGGCIVCKSLADTISHEFNIEAVPIQKLYKEYNLEHDAYLIMGDVRYRGYSWIIPYLTKGRFKKLLTILVLSSYPITVKYNYIKELGGNPMKYLGRGKIPLKMTFLFLSVHVFKWIFKVWIKIWGLRINHPI